VGYDENVSLRFPPYAKATVDKLMPETDYMFIPVRAVIASFALLVTAACGSPSPQPGSAPAGEPAPTAAPAAAPTPLPGESTVTGTIKYEGTAEKPRVVRMDSDPLCMPEGPQTSEVLVVGPDNGIQNAFVYVKDGLSGDLKFTAPQTPVVLDQKGCKYSPHVFGVQVGQPVIIVNSDPTLHNVHAVPKANTEFNFGQATKGMKTTRTFDKPEVMVPFRCDVHGWMASYGGVVAHPFFAVTKSDGTFEIKGLPAGTYTIEVWHERLGTQTTKVTVDGKSGATANVAFKG
jgi:plastocyanin